MPLRFLLKYLANNERLVQKIAESYPVRRAAQLCVSIYYRTQNIARNKLESQGQIDKNAIYSFFNRFKQNVSEGWGEAKKQLKDNERKK